MENLTKIGIGIYRIFQQHKDEIIEKVVDAVETVTETVTETVDNWFD